jgi:hypothetical protein
VVTLFPYLPGERVWLGRTLETDQPARVPSVATSGGVDWDTPSVDVPQSLDPTTSEVED